MNSNDWELVKNLFEQTLALIEVERDAFLRSQTINNPEVYSQVTKLLDADQKNHVNITKILSSNLEEIFEEQAYLSAGDKVDQYEVVRLIGQGGMGAVFEGKRQDKGFEQRVALKVIQTNHLTKDAIARFQSERQILANLNHPNIAHLLDGGTTKDGAPYLVMEYIDGEPILDYCKKNHLSIKKRIELFLQICKAVSYAHQNLVVHRDIKPENILVNSEGQAKLLDFGIAKVLNPNAYLQDIVETQVETRIMSLENAAPEQILNQDITTRTDVYALGNLLYQLLTEETLFKIKEKTRLYLEQAICETQPIKPSSAVTLTNTLLKSKYYSGVNTLQKKLKGDLDNITLKALKKDPEDRYRTVEQFSEDINRYLKNYPVIARPESVLYLFSRFVKRNRAIVSISILFTVSIVFFSIFLALQSIQLELEKNKALEESELANQTTQFLTDIFSASDPNKNAGKEQTASELLAQGRDKVRELEGSIKLKATMKESIARIYHKKGEYQEAIDLYEESISLRKLAEENYSKKLASTYSNLAQVHFDLSNFDKSESYFLKAINTFEKLGSSSGVNLIQATGNLFTLYVEQAKYKQALKISDLLIEKNISLFGESSMDVAIVYTQKAQLYRRLSQYKKSKLLLEKSLETTLKLVGEKHLETAHRYNHLASTLFEMKLDEKALDYAIKGLSIRREIYKKEHLEVALSLGMVSNIYAGLNKLDEAIEYRAQATEMAKSLFGDGSLNHSFFMIALGDMYRKNKQYDLAKKVFKKALSIQRHELDSTSVHLAISLTGLAKIALLENKLSLAKNYITESYNIRKSGLPKNHWLIALSASIYAEIYADEGNTKSAKLYWREAKTIVDTIDPQTNRYIYSLAERLSRLDTLID